MWQVPNVSFASGLFLLASNIFVHNTPTRTCRIPGKMVHASMCVCMSVCLYYRKQEQEGCLSWPEACVPRSSPSAQAKQFASHQSFSLTGKVHLAPPIDLHVYEGWLFFLMLLFFFSTTKRDDFLTRQCIINEKHTGMLPGAPYTYTHTHTYVRAHAIRTSDDGKKIHTVPERTNNSIQPPEFKHTHIYTLASSQSTLRYWLLADNLPDDSFEGTFLFFGRKKTSSRLGKREGVEPSTIGGGRRVKPRDALRMERRRRHSIDRSWVFVRVCRKDSGHTFILTRPTKHTVHFMQYIVLTGSGDFN